MLFRWYSENRHFRKGSGLKGQIAPFLLVILVLLLVAAITTINIGRVAIDKTYTGNAADAGALSGASGMAGIMNSLSLSNQGLLDTYVSYHTAYLQLLNMAEGHLEDVWITMAVISALQLAAVALAYFYEYQGSVSCYAGFRLSSEYFVTVTFLALCATLIHLVLLPKLIRLSVEISSLKQNIEDFHDGQLENYCNIRESIDENTDLVEKSAYSLAFENSGISEKLSDEQVNDYSAWMGTESYTSGKYSWVDKLGQGHSVAVNVSVPRVSTYVMQHTVLSYPKEIEILDAIISDVEDISEIVNSVAISIDTAIANYIALAALGLEIGILWKLCVKSIVPVFKEVACTAWVIACAIWYPAAVLAGGYLNFIGGLVSFLMGVSGGLGSRTLYGLNNGLEESWKGLDPNGSVSSASCADASNLLIVQFESVPYPGDVRVSSTQSHPGVSSGIAPTSYPSITSSSTASYTGGDVGSFDDSYDSRLSSAN
jgi:hypothetical protein